MTDTQIASLATGQPTDRCWSDPADTTILQAVDELHMTNDLRDET